VPTLAQPRPRSIAAASNLRGCAFASIRAPSSANVGQTFPLCAQYRQASIAMSAGYSASASAKAVTVRAGSPCPRFCEMVDAQSRANSALMNRGRGAPSRRRLTSAAAAEVARRRLCHKVISCQLTDPAVFGRATGPPRPAHERDRGWQGCHQRVRLPREHVSTCSKLMPKRVSCGMGSSSGAASAGGYFGVPRGATAVAQSGARRNGDADGN
jgi:hypothetical protein